MKDNLDFISLIFMILDFKFSFLFRIQLLGLLVGYVK